jgi:hypothetical protein
MPPLTLLPGRLLVTFLLRLGDHRAALVVDPPRFLEGLRAALAALSFAELCRDDDRPEELLPWAGNV